MVSGATPVAAPASHKGCSQRCACTRHSVVVLAGVDCVHQYLSHCSIVKSRYKKWWRRLLDSVIDGNARILFNLKQCEGTRSYSRRAFMLRAHRQRVVPHPGDLQAAERRAPGLAEGVEPPPHRQTTCAGSERPVHDNAPCAVSCVLAAWRARPACRHCPCSGSHRARLLRVRPSEPGGVLLHPCCADLVHEPTARGDALREAAVRTNGALWSKWRTRVKTSPALGRGRGRASEAAARAAADDFICRGG